MAYWEGRRSERAVLTMPDIKEKLVEVLTESGILCNDCGPHGNSYCIETIANHLIANGVTIQKWISVEERLPTEADADDVGAVLAIHKAARKKYYHWRSVADNPFDFTYWMPLPEPPVERVPQ